MSEEVTDSITQAIKIIEEVSEGCSETNRKCPARHFRNK
jgi:hypothetical protein